MKHAYDITINCKSKDCCARWEDTTAAMVDEAHRNAKKCGWVGSDMGGLYCPFHSFEAAEPAPRVAE